MKENDLYEILRKPEKVIVGALDALVLNAVLDENPDYVFTTVHMDEKGNLFVIPVAKDNTQEFRLRYEKFKELECPWEIKEKRETESYFEVIIYNLPNVIRVYKSQAKFFEDVSKGLGSRPQATFSFVGHKNNRLLFNWDYE